MIILDAIARGRIRLYYQTLVGRGRADAAGKVKIAQFEVSEAQRGRDYAVYAGSGGAYCVDQPC